MLLGALNETERRFRLISDNTPVLIWVADTTGKLGFFNRAWVEFIGISIEASHTVDWTSYVHPDDRAAYFARLEAILVDHLPAEVEYRLRCHDGQYHWFLEKILPRYDSTDVLSGLIASATDITGIKQAEEILSQSNKELEEEVARRTEQLEQLMLTDPLTGVGNRRRLMKTLEDEILRFHRYGHPLTVVFFDIDHFKRINDAHGHSIGDVVLARVAE